MLEVGDVYIVTKDATIWQLVILFTVNSYA